MQLSSVERKTGLKAIETLKALAAAGNFDTSESLSNIEELLINATIRPLSEVETTKFKLPLEFINEFEFFCFSDGACRGNPGPGAWGSIIQDSAAKVIYECSGVENPSTNNRMEMTGALRCLEYLKKGQNLDKSVLIVSDSKYVVDGMNQWVSGWKKRGWLKSDKKTPENVDIWKNLDQLRLEFRNVKFTWVKGHAGHPQNEKCDQLANEALDNAGF